MHLYKLLRKWLRREQGSVFILMGAVILLLITSTGVAIDMARAQTLQQKIATALDAAGLAAGATVNSPPSGTSTSTWVQSQAQKYFNANFPAGYMGTQGTITVSAVLTNNGSTISLNASAVQSTAMMKVVGITTTNVGASSTISLPGQNTGLQLVLVLDNTGSMASTLPGSGGSKISGLQTAVGTLLNEVYGSSNDHVFYTGDANNTSLIWVGMVPFSDMVNIGEWSITNTSFSANGYNGSSFSSSFLPGSYFSASLPSSWSGCVDARTPLAPVAKYLYAGGSTPNTLNTYLTSTYAGKAWISPLIRPATPNAYNNDGCAMRDPASAGDCFTYNSGTYTNLSYDISLDMPSSGAKTFTALSGTSGYCPHPIVPLQYQKSVVSTAAQQLTAQGSTMIHIGAAWGWRMINTDGSSTWPNLLGSGTPTGLNDIASNFSRYLTLISSSAIKQEKVMVIMTDGVNTDPGTGSTNNAQHAVCGPGTSTASPALTNCQLYGQTTCDSSGINYKGPLSVAANNTYVCSKTDSWMDCDASNPPNCKTTAGKYCSSYSGSGTSQSCTATGSTYSCPAGHTCINVTSGYPYSTSGSSAYADVATSGGDAKVYTSDPTEITSSWPWSGENYLTKNLCDAIKAQGIIIYTIGFGTDDGVTVTSGSCSDPSCATFVDGELLQYCATDSAHYYLATTNAALNSVFATIGNGLGSLRVSQ